MTSFDLKGDSYDDIYEALKNDVIAASVRERSLANDLDAARVTLSRAEEDLSKYLSARQNRAGG